MRFEFDQGGLEVLRNKTVTNKYTYELLKTNSNIFLGWR